MKVVEHESALVITSFLRIKKAVNGDIDLISWCGHEY